MRQPIGLSRLFFFVALASCISFGQAASPLVPLRITDETPVSSLRVNARGIHTVGGNGEFYVSTGPGRYISVDLDGETHPALDLASVPATEGMSSKDLILVDLAPDTRGGVLGTVLWDETPTKTRYGLVRFDSDGAYDGLTWIDADAGFTPTHAVEFSSSGNFLICGYDEHGKIKVALFDFRGFLLKQQVVAYGDKEGSTSKGAAGQSAQAADEHAMREAGMIQMASAEDDSVYLYNSAWGRKVIRVQSSGKATEISLANPHSNTMPMELVVSHGYLYLCEATLDEGQKVGPLKSFSISVYDRYNGTLMASYEVKGAYGLAFVAASPRDFYFLSLRVPPGDAVNFSLIREQP